MNPSRVTNADIDTDYSSKDREKVKKFILHDHMNLPNVRSSEIITFNTVALKGAIKDIGRALKMPLADLQIVCDAVYQDDKKVFLIDDLWRKKYPELFKYVDIINGTVVSIGSHPSGVLVSDLDIESEIGMCSLSTSDYPVSMLNMKELDDLMYVKLDILGLDNIGVINDTCKLANIERLTPDNVDLNDMDVWKSIRDDTTLIFQWESDSAQAYLRRFMSDDTLDKVKNRVNNFSMIKWFSFGNGLIRPACTSYRDDVANGIFYDNGLKELDDFLAPTMGRVTMQEDIMQFLVKFCGYSDAESDIVRRGIAKKYGTEKFLPEIESRFIEYSSTTYGESKEKCAEIIKPFLKIILAASAYSFSWNHSDSYSCIGYICGYLRYYYPLEFLTAALNIFEGKEEKTISITNYAKKNNIPIKSIKFRHSIAEYSFDKDKREIYKGISSIKYLNSTIANDLYTLRDFEGDFIELLIKIQETAVNSKQLDILIKLGFFDEFGDINYLLPQVVLFDSLYGKKQIKKDKLSQLKIDENVIRSFSKKETDKFFTQVDITMLLKSVVENLHYREANIIAKIRYQQEMLGYIDIQDERFKGRLMILNIDVKYAPRLQVYALANGEILNVKIDKRTYNTNKVNAGDVIAVKKIKKKPKVKKDVDGQFVPIEGTEELWLAEYKKIEV